MSTRVFVFDGYAVAPREDGKYALTFEEIQHLQQQELAALKDAKTMTDDLLIKAHEKIAELGRERDELKETITRQEKHYADCIAGIKSTEEHRISTTRAEGFKEGQQDILKRLREQKAADEWYPFEPTNRLKQQTEKEEAEIKRRNYDKADE